MRLAGIAFACLIATLATGCCMCAAPYDYCAPTFTGQCGDDCRPHARVNSAFSYGPGVYGYGTELAAVEDPVMSDGAGELPSGESAAELTPDPMPGTHSALRKRSTR
jgi:hypothetical protein